MRYARLASAVFLTAMLAGILFGQGNTGSILGTVVDPSGSVVPNAKITITNTQTGVQASVLTDSLGNYLFNFLAPGTYRSKAS